MTKLYLTRNDRLIWNLAGKFYALMAQFNNRQLKTFSTVGILLGLIPVIIFTLWIYANSLTDGYPQNVELFRSYFPAWLRGRWSTTYLSLICCVLCMTACGIGLGLKVRTWRLVNRTFVILAGLLMFLNLWSMM